MSNPESNKSSREDKRRKQRENLSAAFGDPLMRISVPAVVREFSAEIDKGATQFEERVRSLSAKSNESVDSGNVSQAKEYVENRKILADEMMELSG